MKYLQNGSFQNNSLMKLTLLFTLLFLTAFWVTNFALFFAKMNLTPHSVQAYYLGSEELFKMPRTYQSMLEVTHAHLPMMALVILLLTHLLIFAPYQIKTKVTLIISGFLFALLNEGSGWLVRFVSPNFTYLKIFSYLAFQSILGFLIFALGAYLFTGGKHHRETVHSTSEEIRTIQRQI